MASIRTRRRVGALVVAAVALLSACARQSGTIATETPGTMISAPETSVGPDPTTTTEQETTTTGHETTTTSTAPVWVRTFTDDGKFSFELPDAPVRTVGTISTYPGTIVVTDYELLTATERYLVSVFDVSPELRP